MTMELCLFKLYHHFVQMVIIIMYLDIELYFAFIFDGLAIWWVTMLAPNSGPKQQYLTYNIKMEIKFTYVTSVDHHWNSDHHFCDETSLVLC